MSAVLEHIPATMPAAVAVAAPQADNFLLIIERALSNPDIQVEKLGLMIDMKIRWDTEQRKYAKEDAAEEAKRHFAASMAAFKLKAPTILKAHHVKYENKDGTFTEYDHAKLSDVCEAVIGELAAVGIVHDWIVRQDQARIFVECVLTHVAGHTKSVAMNAAPDATGGKNAIQSIASATSYLQRYTLLAVTGLATKDMDDDGRSTGPTQDTQTSAQTPAAPLALTYDPAKFNTNFAKWSTLITSGKKTAADVIATVEAAAPLSAEQKKRINDIKVGSKQ